MATDNWKERLLRSFNRLVADTDLYRALDACFEKAIFTNAEREHVEQWQTHHEKNERFLTILLRKSEDDYKIFLECLKADQMGHVISVISGADTYQPLISDIEEHLLKVDFEEKGLKLTSEDLERIQNHLEPEEISPRKLEDWKKYEKTFYPTKATRQVSEKIISEKKVIVCGLPGAGKTAVIRHVALQLKNEGYRLCCVQTFNEVKWKMDKFAEDEKQVYVIDDVFGVHGVDELKRKQWCDDNKDEVERCLDNSNISILCSSRIQVIQDPQLKRIKPRFTIVNISEGPCELSKDEHTGIFRNHAITKQRNDLLMENKGQLRVEIKEKVREIEYPVGCFPLVCHLYTGDKEPKQTIEEFFNKPLNVIADHITKLEVEDPLSHFCLLLCLIYENKLPVNTLKVGKEEEETKNKREELLEICELSPSTLRLTIKNKMNSLLQTFVKLKGYRYQFVHDIVHDAVINHVCKMSSDVLEVILRHCKVLICVACKRRCDVNVIQSLINAGADVNTPDVFGVTSLWWSVAHSDYETTQLLLDHKANLCEKDGQSVLLLSVRKRDYETAQLLIDHNADVNQCDAFDQSILFWSVEKGDYKSSQLLLSCGADVNQREKNFGWSALYMSVYKGYYKLTQLLLQHGANVNACDNGGRSALYRSQLMRNDAITSLLQSSGAVCLYKRKEYNHVSDIPSLPLCDCVEHNNYELVKLLIDRGADVNQCDTYYDWSALFMSQLMEYDNITSILLSQDALCLYKGKYYSHVTDIPDYEPGDYLAVLIGDEFVRVQGRIRELKEEKTIALVDTAADESVNRSHTGGSETK